jgi:hypothetical protein
MVEPYKYFEQISGNGTGHDVQNLHGDGDNDDILRVCVCV